jgi:branched-chain amino acid transport system permease protein
MGMIQTFAVVIDYSVADLLGPLGIALSGDNLLTEIMTVPVARIGALLPFLMMVTILFFRPRGLMGTRDT